MSRFATLLVVITMTLVSSARAQTNVFGEPVPVVATSLAELQPLLEPDTVVQVMDATGMKVRGTFGRDALVLPDQPLRAWWGDDPVTNGAQRGFWIGLGVGIIPVSRACHGAADAPGQLVSCTALSSALAAAGGALVGVIVDGLVHHKELRVDYRAAARPIP